jgi:hypothetical protein
MSGEEELKMGHVVWVGRDEEAERGLDAWREKLILSVQEFLRLGGWAARHSGQYWLKGEEVMHLDKRKSSINMFT